MNDNKRQAARRLPAKPSLPSIAQRVALHLALRPLRRDARFAARRRALREGDPLITIQQFYRQTLFLPAAEKRRNALGGSVRLFLLRETWTRWRLRRARHTYTG